MASPRRARPLLGAALLAVLAAAGDVAEQEEPAVKDLIEQVGKYNPEERFESALIHLLPEETSFKDLEEDKKGEDKGRDYATASRRLKGIDIGNTTKALDFGISVMLLLNFALAQAILFSVNHWDKDIRRHSWNTISAALPIFCAVLLFKACNELVHFSVLKDVSDMSLKALIVNCIHMLLWCLVAQMYRCWNSRAGEGDSVYRNLHQVVRTTLLFYIAAFASINALAVLQKQGCWAPLVVVIVWTSMLLLCVGMLAEPAGDVVLRFKSEHVSDKQNDFIALSVSFILCQWMRYALTGTLPTPEGNEKEDIESKHPAWEIVTLSAIGIAFALLGGVRPLFPPGVSDHRVMESVWKIGGMTFAWTTFSSSTWVVAKLTQSGGSMMEQIVIAGILTGGALMAIFLVGQSADDLPFTRKQVEKPVRTLVKALGILIGFSWGRAFDIAVYDTAEKAQGVMPCWAAKLIMVIVVGWIAISNWQNYILPTALKLNQEAEEIGMDESGRGNASTSRTEEEWAKRGEQSFLGATAQRPRTVETIQVENGDPTRSFRDLRQPQEAGSYTTASKQDSLTSERDHHALHQSASGSALHASASGKVRMDYPQMSPRRSLSHTLAASVSSTGPQKNDQFLE